jgi:capsular exopolysaccharide synthesis family protein
MELRTYLEILWRRKWVFLQAVGIIVLVAVASIILMKPIYKATTQVRIDTQDILVQFFSSGAGKSLLPSNLGKTTFTTPENAIGTFEAMIENNEYISKVIQELNLKHTDDLVSIRDRRNEFIEVLDFINPGASKLIMQRKGVGISQVSGSDILEINGYSTSTEEAVDIANKAAASFLEFLKDTNRQKVLETYDLMEKEALRIEKDLRKAEKAVEDFKKENQAVNLDDQIKALIGQKSGLENDLYETQRLLKEIKFTLQGVKKALSKQPETRKSMTTIEANPLLLSYKNNLLDLELSLTRTLIELTPQHATVKQIQSQIEKAKEKIKGEVAQTFASHVTTPNPHYDSLVTKYIDIEVKTVSLTAGKMVLSEQIGVIDKKLIEIPSKELKLKQLTRKMNALNVTYTNLLEQSEMAKIAKDMDIANATIIETASIPVEDPSNYIYFPKRVMMSVLSLFLGSTFGLFMVFFLEYIDDSFRYPEDIKNVLNYAVIGMIPRTSKKYLDLTERKDKASLMLMNRFLDLGSEIRLITSEEGPRILSVVSAGKNDGKTTVASHLAYIFSKSKDRVLLVDGNLRGHSVLKSLNMSTNVGFSDLLQGLVKLEDVIQSRMERLDVIPNGTVINNPLIFLDSDIMSNVIKNLKKRYDLVIIDTPAIDKGNDAITISRHCDKVLFVIASGESSRQKVKRAVESFKRFKTPILGIVLNKTGFDRGSRA